MVRPPHALLIPCNVIYPAHPLNWSHLWLRSLADSGIRDSPQKGPMVRSGLVGEGLTNKWASAHSACDTVRRPDFRSRLLHRPGALSDLCTRAVALRPTDLR